MPKFNVVTPLKRDGHVYQPGDEVELSKKAARAIPWAVERPAAKAKEEKAGDPTDGGNGAAEKK